MMGKRRRHTPDQIIRKVAEGHRPLSAGQEFDQGAARKYVLDPNGLTLAA